jgi:hypothetical protein
LLDLHMRADVLLTLQPLSLFIPPPRLLSFQILFRLCFSAQANSYIQNSMLWPHWIACRSQPKSLRSANYVPQI